MAADPLGSSLGFTEYGSKEREYHPCGGECLVDIRQGSEVRAGGLIGDQRKATGIQTAAGSQVKSAEHSISEGFNLEAVCVQSGPSQFIL